MAEADVGGVPGGQDRLDVAEGLRDRRAANAGLGHKSRTSSPTPGRARRPQRYVSRPAASCARSSTPQSSRSTASAPPAGYTRPIIDDSFDSDECLDELLHSPAADRNDMPASEATVETAATRPIAFARMCQRGGRIGGGGSPARSHCRRRRRLRGGAPRNRRPAEQSIRPESWAGGPCTRHGHRCRARARSHAPGRPRPHPGPRSQRASARTAGAPTAPGSELTTPAGTASNANLVWGGLERARRRPLHGQLARQSQPTPTASQTVQCRA